jgi:Domain of unknown function (DUF397)
VVIVDQRYSEQVWRKSARCGDSACVEVARVDGEYLVRDSKNPQGPRLRFTAREWEAFTAGVVAGDFQFE